MRSLNELTDIFTESALSVTLGSTHARTRSFLLGAGGRSPKGPGVPAVPRQPPRGLPLR